jgi:hypothetical protein
MTTFSGENNPFTGASHSNGWHSCPSLVMADARVKLRLLCSKIWLGDRPLTESVFMPIDGLLDNRIQPFGTFRERNMGSVGPPVSWVIEKFIVGVCAVSNLLDN